VQPVAAELKLGDEGPAVKKVYDYLARFGYFPNAQLDAEFEGFRPIVEATPPNTSRLDGLMERAITAFQANHGLPVTGRVDAATRALIAQPRCGYPDVPADAAPYVTAGKWKNKSLTYRFVNTTPDLSASRVKAAIASAKTRWEDVADITLAEVSGSSSDINIRWFAGTNHPAGFNDFDGPSNVLAWGHFPEQGKLYFDEDETWTDADPIPAGTGNIDLESVAVHELGHVLGLDHSADTSAVMYAYYNGIRRNLTADDIDGMQTQYGPSFGWHAGYTIPRTGTFTLAAGGGIAANSRSATAVDTWAIGKDGALWSAGWWDGTWHEPYKVSTTPNGTFGSGSGIAANSRTSSMVDTWVIKDGNLWSAGYWDGTWHAPYRAPLAASDFVNGGGIAVNSRTPGMVDTWVIGKDGALWNAGYWDGAWHNAYRAPLQNVEFVSGGGIAANSRTGTTVDTWVIGKDGALWNAGYWDGTWHAPYKVPTCPAGTFNPGSQLAVNSRTPGMVDIWVVGKDGALWSAGYWDGSWHAPYRAPKTTAGVFVPGGGIAATSRTSTILDTWSIANDEKPANAGYWTGK
jgi:hypothetical protein